jgi:hypothetical protein
MRKAALLFAAIALTAATSATATELPVPKRPGVQVGVSPVQETREQCRRRLADACAATHRTRFGTNLCIWRFRRRC